MLLPAGFEAGCVGSVLDLLAYSVERDLDAVGVGVADDLGEPGVGIGKREPLGRNLSGYWSRRITDEHRRVYTVDEDSVVIIQARYHY